jgi:alkylation response protein AidB-like acyl-CoA dehydrogenase
VFFEGAKVALSDVVGEIGEGWKVAMTTLGAERTFAQLSRYRQYETEAARIGNMLLSLDTDARSKWLERYGRIRADLTGIRNLSYKITSLATAGEELGALTSVTKLWWSTTHQRLVDLGYEIAVDADQDVDFWYRLWLESRGETIYAGASQIQKNIISERMLGLPR